MGICNHEYGNMLTINAMNTTVSATMRPRTLEVAGIWPYIIEKRENGYV
jgi:hypothetical protein